MQGNKKGKQLPYRYKESETEGSLDGGRSAPQVQDKVGKKAGWNGIDSSFSHIHKKQKTVDKICLHHIRYSVIQQ